MCAAALALVLLVATQSQGPSPAPTETAQKQQNKSTPKQSETAPNSQPAPNSAPAINQSTPKIAVRYEQKFGQQGEGKAPTNWWSILNTALLTIFNGALAWLAFRQAGLMKGQLEEMKTTSKDTNTLAQAAVNGTDALREQGRIMVEQVNAVLTQTMALKISAEAAAKSADAATHAVNLTRLLERPWVTAALRAQTHLRFEDSGPWITFWLELKNIGSTIATDVRYGCELLCVPRWSDESPARDPTIRSGVQVLFPSETSEQIVHVSIEADAIDPQCIVDDAATLQISGVIKYRSPTSEDIVRHTRFLYYVGRYDRSLASITVKRGETVPPDEISFVKLPSASYAD